MLFSGLTKIINHYLYQRSKAHQESQGRQEGEQEMRFQHTIYQDLPALNKESQARKSLISKFWDIRGEALKGSPYIVWSSHYKVLRVGKQEIETA